MSMYMPKPWNLNPDMMESEYAIFEEACKAQEMKTRICTGMVALLYEQLLILEGSQLPEVYPISDNARARKFLTLVYASSAFLYSSAIMDLAARGRYLESECLMRSLLETVAFTEYFNLNEEECLSFFKSRKGIPNNKKVYEFLRNHGQFPQGGPEKVIARFHASAHANIFARMQSWIIRDSKGNFVGLHTHKFDSDSFVRVLHHLIMPLIGIQQFLYDAFESRMSTSIELTAKWQLARNMDLIKKEFPDLMFRTTTR